jgi:hypothetical protein
MHRTAKAKLPWHESAAAIERVSLKPPCVEDIAMTPGTGETLTLHTYFPGSARAAEDRDRDMDHQIWIKRYG